MNKTDLIFGQVKEIFHTVFEDKSIEILRSSTPNTIEKWDSVNNILIINAVEEFYKISIDIDSIFEIQTVNDLCIYIEKNAVII